jgi:hypothetical protein
VSIVPGHQRDPTTRGNHEQGLRRIQTTGPLVIDQDNINHSYSDIAGGAGSDAKITPNPGIAIKDGYDRRRIFMSAQQKPVESVLE